MSSKSTLVTLKQNQYEKNAHWGVPEWTF
jgi:hypothetical protein